MLLWKFYEDERRPIATQASHHNGNNQREWIVKSLVSTQWSFDLAFFRVICSFQQRDDDKSNKGYDSPFDGWSPTNWHAPRVYGEYSFWVTVRISSVGRNVEFLCASSGEVSLIGCSGFVKVAFLSKATPQKLVSRATTVKCDKLVIRWMLWLNLMLIRPMVHVCSYGGKPFLMLQVHEATGKIWDKARLYFNPVDTQKF